MLRSLQSVFSLLAVVLFAMAADAAPALTSISPNSGYPGTQVTLNGTGFAASQGTGSVWLGSKLAGSIVSWSDTQIVAAVASGAASGNAIVQQGGVWSNSIPFTVIKPNITSINPASGFPGTQVTFTGTNFGASGAPAQVWLGNKAAGSIVSWSDTQVVAVVAANAASGSAQIQANGVWSNSIPFTVPTPSIVGITPNSGAVGTQVTFTGTNFGATQGTGSVWLGSKLAGSIVSWSNTQIVAAVATGSASGSAQVQQGGVWSNSMPFTVTTPTLTSVSPTTARAGDEITLTGNNFGATGTVAQVWLGNKIAGSIVSWSNTQIVATVASGAKSGTAQVQQGGVWSNSIAFTVITPNITSLSATSGPPGTTIAIEGTGFGDTQGSGLVWLGTKYAAVLWWTDTYIVATVASDSATGGTQVFQNGVWSNSITFTVTPPAIVSFWFNREWIEAQISYNGEATGSVTVDTAAPPGGFVISIVTSDPALIAPSSVTIPEGEGTVTFTVRASAVSAITNVTISASLNASTITTSLNLHPCWESYPTPNVLAYPNDVVWFDDDLPPGMSMGNATWDTTNVVSGTRSLTQPSSTGYQSFVFTGATTTITPNAFERLFALVWLARCETPAEVMFGWHTTGGEWKKAYFGAPLIGGETSALNLGPLPSAYGPINPNVLASQLGIDGQTIDGFSVEIPNGKIWVDRVGKTCEQVPPPDPALPGDDIIWMDDAAPAGASTFSLVWDTSQSASGTKSIKMSHGQYTNAYNAPNSVNVPMDTNIVFYVLPSECLPPEELMVTLMTADGLSKRLYWGTPHIGNEANSIAMGSVPPVGQWTRIEIPARMLGFETHPFNGITLQVWGGEAWFDAVGIGAPTCITNTAPEPSIPSGDRVWIDDVMPAGVTLDFGSIDATQHASGMQSLATHWDGGGSSVDAYINAANAPFRIETGENLLAYVLTNACDPPNELSIRWTPTDGTPARGVYYGTERTGTTLNYMGPMPAAGSWFRVEVPATLLGFERKSIANMTYRVSHGKAWIDRIGASGVACIAATAPAPTIPSGDTVWLDEGETAQMPWVTTQAASGTQSITAPATAWGERSTYTTAQSWPVAVGEKLVFYVLFDECAPPTEFLIRWWTTTSGGGGAYWGVSHGQQQEGLAYQLQGPMPQSGVWHRFEIPASTFGIGGKTVNAVKLIWYDGDAWVDHIGKAP